MGSEGLSLVLSPASGFFLVILWHSVVLPIFLHTFNFCLSVLLIPVTKTWESLIQPCKGQVCTFKAEKTVGERKNPFSPLLGGDEFSPHTGSNATQNPWIPCD